MQLEITQQEAKLIVDSLDKMRGTCHPNDASLFQHYINTAYKFRKLAEGEA